MSQAGPAAAIPPPIPLKASHWLILCMAAIGFAFDTYALLVMPIIARPALSSLLQVDPDTASGTQEILAWTGYIMWGSALCGGVFGLLGGYLTDWLGRRRVLTWSILLYAFSALASGFVSSAGWFLVLRLQHVRRRLPRIRRRCRLAGGASFPIRTNVKRSSATRRHFRRSAVSW